MAGQEIDSVYPITLASFNPASLTGSYQVLNGSGTSDNCKILKIYNGSSTIGITISFDGVNDHDFWPPLATLIIDYEANHYSINGSGTKYVNVGQQIWGKTTTNPTWLFISGFR